MNDGTLLTFVGNRDPYAGDSTDEPGPVLSLLGEKLFGRVFIFCTGPDYFERAKTVEAAVLAVHPETRFNFVSLELKSVIDYEEIYRKLQDAIDKIRSFLPAEQKKLSILLDPGTPQMQTSWFLLAKAGILRAELLQGVPPRFAGGAYKVKTVNLESSVFPRLSPAPRDAFPDPRGEPPAREPEGGWITSPFEDTIIGDSIIFRKVLDQAKRFAAYDSVSVLIRGETGSGKGLLARLIHDLSGRREKPFLPINCAAVTATLAESEFFGHAKGAFTGADKERIGKFRAAEGGTIFLDEIGDLPLELQPKLLRVLEDRTVIPVGSEKEMKVDVRVLAATNRNIEELLEKKLFRRDLYERLNNATLSLPPLRERKEDIPKLINRFLGEWNSRYHEKKGFAAETVGYLTEYPWPGNVRELQNTVTTLCAAGQGSSIGPELLPQTIIARFRKKSAAGELEFTLPAEGLNLKALLFQIERDFYLKALERAGGNKEQAAEFLGLNGPAFRKALRERFGEE